MYNLEKRAYFTNLGELRMLLADMSDDTEVCTGGVLGSYLHFAKDKELVSFDDENLSDCYEEYDNDDAIEIEEKKLIEEDESYDSRMRWLDEGRRYMLCGDKLMRTFLADDGSWDYELYDISLSVVDSGQLGEGRSLTRDEVINTVLSWNHLDTAPKQYLAPPIAEEVYDHFIPDYSTGDSSETHAYCDFVIERWNYTDEETKAANDYNIRRYVEHGDFENDAFDFWYRETSFSGSCIDELRKEADFIENAIRAFSQMFSDWQYDIPWGIPKNV